MQPKRSWGTIPIFFLLFIFIFLVSILILLIFFSSSSFHFQSSNPPQTLVNPHHPSSFSLTIKVLSFDRLPSLRRCLLSLSSAHYPPSSSHPIHLHIFLDHLPNSTSTLSLAPSHSILDFVDSFHWPHGDKLVHYRTANAGLQAQWLEAWWPSSDDDFAFVVEDDLEVSPYFYDFLERVILKYYYDQDNYSPDVFGASLQRPRFVAGKHGNKLQVDDETRLFLYQMVGTWGQLLFPKPWKEFRLWYDIHKAKGVRPILQGMVTTGWYKKMGERIWTPWFIKFIHHRGYYNIYTNFLHERALSVSHRDAGVNYGKTAGPDSKLIDESSIDYKLWDFQPLKNLKWYDFCFSQVLPWRVVKSYNELGSVLGTLQRQRTVLLVSLYKTTEKTARNLICQFDMLGIKNFIFVGGKTELLHDLSRRGYPVVDSDIFFNSIKSSYKLTGEKSETDLKKEFLVKGNIIRKSLELGYHCWMMDGNIFPHTNFFTELPDSSYTYSAAKNLDLLFVKSSPASLKFWIVFVSKMVASKSLPSDQNFFVYFAAKALDEMGSEKVWWFDDFKFGAEIGMDNTGQELMKDDKKYVFWSREASQDSVQRDLEKMDMWLIDGDSSCTAVVCNK